MINRTMIATAKRIFRAERKRLSIPISQPEEMRGWLTYRTGWSARDIRAVVDAIQEAKKDACPAHNSLDPASRQSD
jgi:hypothetical protein